VANESPIDHLRALNVKTDRRHDRRELSVDEVRRLLGAAYQGPTRARLTGSKRSLVYRLAVESGLRANELASLTKGSFDFRAEPATVVVEAGSSKRRRRDTLPLRRDTAAELQAIDATIAVRRKDPGKHGVFRGSGAERTGFEPADQLPGHGFSKPALSTTQPPLPVPNSIV